MWGLTTVPQEAFWSKGEHTLVCGVVCEAYPENAPGQYVGCDAPHDWEGIFEFDASGVFDAAMLPLIDPDAETSRQFRMLADACASLAPNLLHGRLDGAAIVGTPAHDWGTARLAGGPPDHRVECGVVSPEGRMIQGSVFDEDVRLVAR